MKLFFSIALITSIGAFLSLSAMEEFTIKHRLFSSSERTVKTFRHMSSGNVFQISKSRNNKSKQLIWMGEKVNFKPGTKEIDLAKGMYSKLTDEESKKKWAELKLLSYEKYNK